MSARTRYLVRGVVASVGVLLVVPGPRLHAQPAAVVSADQRARLDAVLAPLQRPGGPGCGVAAMRAGTIVYERYFGLADLERNVPIGPQTRFLIASSSKTFTAMATVLLALEGRIALDDDVRKYVPELPEQGRPITIRHLLTHTSGLRDDGNLLIMAGWRLSDLQTEDDVMRALVRQRQLNFAPGDEYMYSNSGYALLAVIVSRASGMSFPEFVAARIFRPLGMTETQILDDPAAVVPNRAIGYWGVAQGGVRIARVPYAYGGPSGVLTTLRDFARWDRNYYTMTVGGRAARDLIYVPGRLSDGTPTGYGLGIYIGAFRGRPMLSHAGSSPGFKADFLRFPNEQLSVTVLCNGFDLMPTPVAQAIADILLAPVQQETVGGEADAPVPLLQDIGTLAGSYWNPEIAQASTFLADEGKLFKDGGGEGRFELRHIGGNRFLLPVAPRRMVFAFSRGGDDRMRVRVEVAGERTREFVSVPASGPAVPLSYYAGVYYSPELDAEWTVSEHEGRLVVIRARYGEEPLAPLLPHVFQMSGGFFTLVFAPPAEGRSPSFEVTTERVRRLSFLRTAPRGLPAGRD